MAGNCCTSVRTGRLEPALNISPDKNIGGKTPQQFLADLTVSELALVDFHLAAADTATKQSNDEEKHRSLRKAFVTYCHARVRLDQLCESDKECLSAKLEDLHQKIAAAYFEEP